MTSHPTLTIDVLEAVIDQASDHAPSLCQLSLLCSTLLPRVRFHLFTSIRIETVQQLESSREFLRSCPWLPPLVKAVTLAIAVPEQKSFPNLRLFEVVPVHLLTRLPNLRAWRMVADRNEERRLSFHRCALSCYRKYCVDIRNLHLDYVSFRSVSDFKAFMLAFSCVRTLRCYRVWVGQKNHHSAPDHLGMNKLAQSLRIESLEIGPFVNIDLAECLFDASLATLSNLVLSLYPDPVRRFSERLVTMIGQLPKLSSLTLALLVANVTPSDLTEPERGVLGDIRGLVTILKHVNRTHLEYVQVHFNSDPIAGLGCPLSWDLAPCKALEDVLLTFPRRRVLLQDPVLERRAGRMELWSPVIKHAFPRLNEGGHLTLPRSKPGTADPPGHEAAVSCCCMIFVRDRNWMVTASCDGTIIVWDAPTGTILHEWLAHKGPVMALSLSPDDRQLVSAGGVSGDTLVVWDIHNGVRRAAALDGHSKPATGCVWSFDGTLIASASDDGTVRIWDGLTFEQRDVLEDPRAISEPGCLMFSGDARYLVWTSKSSDNDVECRIWRPLTSEPPRVLLSHPHHKGQSIYALATDSWCRRIATAHNRYGNDSEEHFVQIWDIATGATLAVLAGHSGDVQEVMFAPDGASVLTASRDGFAKIWDTESGHETASLAPSGGDVQSARFSPDGRHIVTASATAVQLWRTDDLSCIAVLAEHETKPLYAPVISVVAFSPDGEFLGFGGSDGMVHFRRLSDFVQD